MMVLKIRTLKRCPHLWNALFFILQLTLAKPWCIYFQRALYDLANQGGDSADGGFYLEYCIPVSKERLAFYICSFKT